MRKKSKKVWWSDTLNHLLFADSEKEPEASENTAVPASSIGKPTKKGL